MPHCKNDKNRTYSGDEPSPKGLGYCAHAEKLYTVKKGLNDFYWIVVPFNESKKWIPLTIPKKFFNDFKKLNVIVKLDPNNHWIKLFLKKTGKILEDTTITKIKPGTWDGSIIVYHTAPPVVYTNKNFVKANQLLAELNN
jgi:hypothetical protein